MYIAEICLIIIFKKKAYCKQFRINDLENLLPLLIQSPSLTEKNQNLLILDR